MQTKEFGEKLAFLGHIFPIVSEKGEGFVRLSTGANEK